MKLASVFLFAFAALCAPALAQDCRQCGAIRVTANFQVWTPIDRDLSGAALGKAVSEASQPLYGVVSRQCELLADAYKGVCRLVEFQVNSGVNDRMLPQFVTPGDRAAPQQRVNANVNAIFEITPASAETPAQKP
jgi:hypothetical protein